MRLAKSILGSDDCSVDRRADGRRLLACARRHPCRQTCPPTAPAVKAPAAPVTATTPLTTTAAVTRTAVVTSTAAADQDRRRDLDSGRDQDRSGDRHGDCQSHRAGDAHGRGDAHRLGSRHGNRCLEGCGRPAVDRCAVGECHLPLCESAGREGDAERWRVRAVDRPRRHAESGFAHPRTDRDGRSERRRRCGCGAHPGDEHRRHRDIRRAARCAERWRQAPRCGAR